MDKMVKGLIVSILYIFIALISLFFIKKKNKISLISIMIISFLFTAFNICATRISSEYGYDRLSYIYDYTKHRSTTSIALDFLFKYMNIMGLTIYEVFYLTTFICVLLTLLAYNISNRTNYKIYLLLLTSEWILFTITALKQAYACALATLFLVIVIENKKNFGVILSTIILILIVMFHISGLIFIPLLLLLRKKKINGCFIKIITIILILVFFEFNILMFYFKEGVKIFFPAYGIKINNYLQLLNLNFSGGFLKYFYIYYIAILGLIMEKKYSKIIIDYNKYLLLTVMGAFLILYSVKIYWFTRFIGLFYFPIFIFYQMLNNQIENNNIKKISDIIVYGGSLFFLLRKIMLIYINYGFF